MGLRGGNIVAPSFLWRSHCQHHTWPLIRQLLQIWKENVQGVNTQAEARRGRS